MLKTSQHTLRKLTAVKIETNGYLAFNYIFIHQINDVPEHASFLTYITSRILEGGVFTVITSYAVKVMDINMSESYIHLFVGVLHFFYLYSSLNIFHT